MPKVDFIHEEYTKMLPKWVRIQDCIDGQDAVKKKQHDYLPRPNPMDTSKENQARYQQYLDRAVFYNVTGRTLAGLVGEVMAEAPKVKWPSGLEHLQNNIDGAGMNFDQQATEVLRKALGKGRCGLLVDFPVAGGTTTREQLTRGEVQPTIALYDAETIINWRVAFINGKHRLSLVVLVETYIKEDDGFEAKLEPQWRVLSLEPQTNTYVVTIYIKGGGGFEVKPGTQPVTVLDSSGKPMQEIPFIFVSPVSNEPTVVTPPLLDMADLNIAHYRNSADYEEACYICGQPTPYFTGLTEDWVKTVLKDGVQLGSRAAVLLPVDANAGLLQAQENSMPKEAMEAKERQMVALGARLVEQSKVQRTATEAASEQQGESSVLAAVANNVSQAYQSALRFALGFIRSVTEDEEIELHLNNNFRSRNMTAQERAQLSAEWVAGAITDEEMRAALTRCGVAFMDLETWKQKREEQALTKPIDGTTPTGDNADADNEEDTTPELP